MHITVFKIIMMLKWIKYDTTEYSNFGDDGLTTQRSPPGGNHTQ